MLFTSVRIRPVTPKIKVMEKTLRFFKQGNKWYADIPHHTLEDNEMVMGADVALEYLAEERTELFITLTDEYPGWSVPLELKRKDHDDEGAYYTVSGLLFMDFIEKLQNMSLWGGSEPEVWICNVTHDVFGEHPEHIYITKIESK